MRLAAAVGASLVAGLAATSWTALTLAEFGRFRRRRADRRFPGRGRIRLPSPDARPGHRGRAAIAPEDLLAVGIACATLLLTLPPDEHILGGFDPGVYVHTAAAVARSGSLLIDQPDLAALTRRSASCSFASSQGVRAFPGDVPARPDGRISPQFYHLYPCLMAVAWSVGGLRAALLVNPLLNVAAILALYALASLLLGRRWALAAALLHALAAAQIRQAKFPTAEMVTQFFLLAGAALLAQATLEDDPPPRAGPPRRRGARHGGPDALRHHPVPRPAGGRAPLGDGPRRARPGRSSSRSGRLAVFSAQSWLHQQFFSPFYQPVGGLVGGFLAAVAIAVPAVLLLRRTGAWRRLEAAILRRETALRVAVAAALCLLGSVRLVCPPPPRRTGPDRPPLPAASSATRRCRGSPQLLSGPESGNMLYLVDLFGALGIARRAGRDLRPHRHPPAALGDGLAGGLGRRAGGLHAQRFPRPLPDVGQPAVRPGGHAARQRRDRRRRGADRERAAGAGSPVFAWAGVALVAAVIWLNAGATRRDGERARVARPDRLVRAFRERPSPKDAVLYCDQPGFAAPLRFMLRASGVRTLRANSPARREMLTR